MAKRAPIKIKGIFAIIHRLGKPIMTNRPRIILTRIINHNGWIGKLHILGNRQRWEKHPLRNMLNARRHIRLDSCKNIAIAHTNAQGATTPHRVATKVNSVRVNFIFFDHPLNRIHDPFFCRRGRAT